MSDFKIRLRTDQGDIDSYNSIEIPINGPAPANVLISITGVAEVNLDTDNDLRTEDLRHGDVYISTTYLLHDTDHYIDGASMASLASIASDDSTEGDLFDADDVPVLFAVDAIDTEPDATRLIQLHLQIAAAGDIAISKISFQSNILIARTQ